jgi:hypothetical protein
LEATDKYAVTGDGAPWYTSAAHMWNGTKVSLKPTPAITSTNAAHKAGVFCRPKDYLKRGKMILKLVDFIYFGPIADFQNMDLLLNS